MPRTASKSVPGFADFGFWQICGRTACSSRSCVDCDWVAGFLRRADIGLAGNGGMLLQAQRKIVISMAYLAILAFFEG